MVDCYWCPLGGLGIGFPQWDGCGGHSRLALDCHCFGFFLYFLNYSTDGSDFPCSSVQNFHIVEWERVEQNLPQREGVGVPWVVKDQGMESMDSMGLIIHKVCRKSWCFH